MKSQFLHGGQTRHESISVVQLSRDLKVVEAVCSSRQVFRLGDTNVVGEHIASLIPGIPMASIKTVLETANPVRIRGYRLPVAEAGAADSTYLDLTVWPVCDVDGSTTGAVLLLEDVSEQMRRSSRQDEFVATLAHDMKVPLIGNQRVLDHIYDGNLGAVNERLLQTIDMLRRSNQHLLWMVHNLLFIYREQEGKEQLQLSAVSLQQVARDCIEELAPFLESRSIRCRVDIDPDLPPACLDWVGIRRVLTNLLHNASKHTPAGGTVTIGCRYVEDRAELTVADSGEGIPPEVLPTLFTRFWSPPGQNRRGSGSGLGLYVSRQIVELHGGSIECTSNRQTGTRFTIRLPLRALSTDSPSNTPNSL